MAVPGQRRWVGQQVRSLRGQDRLVFARTSTLEYLGEEKKWVDAQVEGTVRRRRP